MLQLVKEEFGTTMIPATHDANLSKHATRKVLMEWAEALIEKVRRDERENSPIGVRF